MKPASKLVPMDRRAVLRAAGAAALCAAPAAWGQARPPEGQWRLLVNEGITADLSIAMLALRYKDWAEYMSAQLRMRQVFVDAVTDIRRFVQQALSDQKPLLVFGKSVNQLSLLVRDHGYVPLVRRPEPYKAAFIVPKGSPIESIGQLGGRKLLVPDESSATAALAKAELRRMAVRGPFLSHAKFQDTVTSQVASGQADAGVVNPTVARKWVEGGGRVIGESQSVVNWSVLAAPKTAPDTVARLTESLLAMNGQAPALMADIGVKQWVRADKAEYLALLDYTGE